MSNYNDFFNELIQNDEELKKQVELLELKYILIETLIDYRKENRISQKKFAESIGVKQQAISRFEKGEIDPRLSFVSKVLVGMKKRLDVAEKGYIKTNESVRDLLEKKDSIGIGVATLVQFPYEVAV